MAMGLTFLAMVTSILAITKMASLMAMVNTSGQMVAAM